MRDYVIVYRLEKNGSGPWQLDDFSIFGLAGKRFRALREHRIHIGRTVDSDIGMIFGCASYKDLRFYFGDKIIKLAISKGYEIKKFKVHRKNVMYGEREVAFYNSQNVDNVIQFRHIVSSRIIENLSTSKTVTIYST